MRLITVRTAFDGGQSEQLPAKQIMTCPEAAKRRGTGYDLAAATDIAGSERIVGAMMQQGPI